MRLIVEQLDNVRYLDLVVTQAEWDRIGSGGICVEFSGTPLEEDFLNIFIRKENTEKFYAFEERKVKKSGKRERTRIGKFWTVSETGCGDQPK